MPSPGRLPTQQSRAEDTAERILQAAERLIDLHGFDATSVADVAAKAGISVGGFYARYRSKKALLHALDEYMITQMLAVLEREMGARKLADQSISIIIRTYIRMMTRFFQKHRTILRQVVTKVRADNEGKTAERIRVFNRRAHSTLKERILTREDDIHHPDPSKAIDLGVMMVSAAAREMVLFDGRALNQSTSSGRELINELTRAFCAYLQADYDPS